MMPNEHVSTEQTEPVLSSDSATIVQLQAELSALQQLLLERDNQIKYQIDQLVALGNLATIGEMTPQVVHEIRSPLGAIRHSATNLGNAARSAIRQITTVVPILSQHQLDLFWQLVDELANPQEGVPLAERRKVKNALQRELEVYDNILDHEEAADKLVILGLTQNIGQYADLLQHQQADLIIEVLYQIGKITIQQSNIEGSIVRTNRIVDVVLRFYRDTKTVEEARPFNLVENIESTLDLFAYRLHDIDLVKDFEGVSDLYGYPEQLTQVWTNLFSNAQFAIAQRGKDKAAAGQRSDSYRGLLQVMLRVEGDVITVSVSDNGSGIPFEVQQRIFEKDFTTKAKGEGTGLGLFICRKILQKHQATIHLQADETVTKFVIQFSIAALAHSPAT
jgi:signal transduction histidine kinase